MPFLNASRRCCALVVVAILFGFGCGQTQPVASAERGDTPAKETPDEGQTGDGKHTDGKFTNRLAKESSPYLLMHAHNPVDWYPWGEEALAKAKKEKKLIFLSVGYSSCHWCHVMERETFLDKEIAAYLNKNFICIKVDREERPDIDTIYMTALHVFNRLSGNGGSGGWPLSMFLTHEAQPIFGGTYFPARDGDRGARVGFFTIVKQLQTFWEKDTAPILRDAATVSRMTKAELEGAMPTVVTHPDESTLRGAQEKLAADFDERWGGFGFSEINPQAPKFPEPGNLVFLLDRYERTKDEAALNMAIRTLEMMAQGGIRDHIGGGFHRYSVDRYWRIPHFEKMLYDNGQLASVYADAYRLTGREDFARVVREMLDFTITEMQEEGGAFYSALDAESEAVEGKFYRWTREELKEVLEEKEYDLFAAIYGINDEPNFEEEYYAPQLSKPLAESAKERGVTEAALVAQLRPIHAKLLKVRNKRTRPLTDTKLLTGWNGLMIAGFADAGRILKEPRYIKAAEQAAKFVLENLQKEDGRLYRTYGEGEAKLNAYVSDYAFLVDGLLSLHEATDNEEYLTAAKKLTEKQIELFWDETRGGFYFTSIDHEVLLARTKKLVDGAVPAGNSVSVRNLLRLSNLVDEPKFEAQAKKTTLAAADLLSRAPHAAPRMLVGVAEIEKAKNEDTKE